MTREQIQALSGDYEHSRLFTEAEKAAIRHAEQVTRDPNGIADADFQEMKKHFGEEQIVEITLVTCLANFTNRFNDSLRVPLDPGMSPQI